MAMIKGDTHIVVKYEDVALLSQGDISVFYNLIQKIEEARYMQGKTINSYLVCNKNEPYASDVLQAICNGEDRKNGVIK